MKLRNAVMAAAMVAATCGIEAQTTVKRTYATPTARFASAIWAGDTLYVAGQMGSPVTPEDKAKGTPADYGDTEAQAESAIKNVEKILKSQGLTLADIVQMECFVAGDPKKDGKMDFAGLNTAYAKFFGTTDQPWGLVEIVVVAVKSK
jgi:enamine deaminase RidA (YjgF/YER057c/UK114 family)